MANCHNKIKVPKKKKKRKKKNPKLSLGWRRVFFASWLEIGGSATLPKLTFFS